MTEGATPARTELVARIHTRLQGAGATVAVAESLTGGLVAAALTAPAGASAVVRGALVVYATDLKHSLAGVEQAVLAEHGAVHPIVAEQLAQGVRGRLAATFGVGVTGVAGPDRQDGRAVGTVFVGVAGPDGNVVRELALSGDRAGIRAAAVDACLGALDEESARQLGR